MEVTKGHTIKNAEVIVGSGVKKYLIERYLTRRSIGGNCTFQENPKKKQV